ncbi:MAG TPA: vitamin K epoxide reductase family protein [Glaciihabitans sp.]|jgi:uncharacterized membrane protein|nr:vitamin K epoxide reductase family protein [Glaciihabitans sp.]
MTRFPSAQRPWALASLLIVTGLVGWYSAFELTLAKIQTLTDPAIGLSCNFSLVVQCGANLDSPQGALLGFPNPLIGLGGFVAPIAVGVALLAGARFERWFWILFNIGVAAAFAFVVWLISQSIFVLGTLCPWCMVVWVVTIPLFWSVTLYNLSSGVIASPRSARRFFTAAYRWVPFITIISYLIIALIAQLRLDVTAYL